MLVLCKKGRKIETRSQIWVKIMDKIVKAFEDLFLDVFIPFFKQATTFIGGLAIIMGGGRILNELYGCSPDDYVLPMLITLILVWLFFGTNSFYIKRRIKSLLEEHESEVFEGNPGYSEGRIIRILEDEGFKKYETVDEIRSIVEEIIKKYYSRKKLLPKQFDPK